MITILMPVYNGIEYLDKSIASVVSQTYPYWNIIIGINGHPKNSDIYKKAKKMSNSKIRVIDFYYLNNKVDTLIEMNKLVKNKYICLLDVDDIWNKNKLMEQIKYINKYDIIGTKTQYFDQNNEIPHIPTGDLSNFDFFKGNPIINSSVLMKKNLLVYNTDKNIKEIESYGLEDYSLWMKLKKLNFKFYNVDKILTYHRIHNTSFFNNKNSNNNLIDLIKDLYR